MAEATWEPGPIIALDAPAAITDFEQRLQSARWRSRRMASGSVGATPSNGTGRSHEREGERERERDGEGERDREERKALESSAATIKVAAYCTVVD